MRVHLGCDHAGFALKQHLLPHLQRWGHEPVDHGPARFDAADDYPPFILATALAVAQDPGSLGIVIGGSGNGEQMAANKVAGIRAALVWNEFTAQAAREHNNAQIISLGARLHSPQEATELVEIFLSTPFSEDPRHARRLAQIAEFERTGVPPTLA
jgi:ribose 5-phosphate isomerase B